MLSRSLVPLTKSFFLALTQRSFAEAERTLDKIKEKAKSTEWYDGYIQALEGMITPLKTNNRYALINQIQADEIKKLSREFNSNSKNIFHKEFDKGFFTAWANYLKHL